MLNENNKFIKYNNIEIIEENANSSIAKLTITQNSYNPYNIVHGGLIFSLGDTVMGVTCRATGRKAVTLDANINFLHQGTGKYLIAKSELLKSGKTTCVLKANIYNYKEELIAVMNATYFFLNWGNYGNNRNNLRIQSFS